MTCILVLQETYFAIRINRNQKNMLINIFREQITFGKSRLTKFLSKSTNDFRGQECQFLCAIMLVESFKVLKFDPNEMVYLPLKFLAYLNLMVYAQATSVDITC